MVSLSKTQGLSYQGNIYVIRGRIWKLYIGLPLQKSKLPSWTIRIFVGQYCHPYRTQYNIGNFCDVDHMIGHPRVNENSYYFINSNVLFNLRCGTIFQLRV